MEHPITPLPDNDPTQVVATATTTDASKRLSSYAAPPYWHHSRSASYATVNSDRGSPITLQDNTESHSPTRHSLWARSITINDYVIINGSNPAGIGAYVVWICKVETLDGSPMIIRKRYSEFDELRHRLVTEFPNSTKTSLPTLPPKSAIYKFRAKFLEKRREGLAYFLNCVMLNPEYASSPIVKDFIFFSDQPMT